MGEGWFGMAMRSKRENAGRAGEVDGQRERAVQAKRMGYAGWLRERSGWAAREGDADGRCVGSGAGNADGRCAGVRCGRRRWVAQASGAG